ncbi:MAG: endonuclease/exonuclease/phosphatase family protein [Acidimicrobiia bacterium]|nr:endonuclease/exonuclease/phosphatase family protein [Acidimicrobiia bacterium]
MKLLAVSWNIEFGLRADEAATILAEHSVLRDADIVLLQEMDEPSTATIAARLGMQHVYAPASTHPQTDRPFGNAILARWPIADPAVTHLPHVAALQGQPRIALTATLDIEGRPVSAVSVHTETPVLSHRKRLVQFIALGDDIALLANEQVILGGDFNTASSRSMQAVTEELARRKLHRMSAGAGPTLRRARRDFVLDHVFAKGFAPVETGVVRGLDVSDHSPIWAQVEMLTPPAE